VARPFYADELQAAAARRTGLSDFGDPGFRTGLEALLDALNHEVHLHAAGRLALRRIMTDHLVNRLLLTHAQQHRPDIFTRPLASPLIVIGLPRSGTTLLHRMLAADPAHYGPPYWELARPLSAGRARPGLTDYRRRYAALTLGLRRFAENDLNRKHFVTVDTPEEDLHTLGATFETWYYWMAAPVYGYLDWYAGQDHRRKYREYRAWLQVLQAAHPGRRLVLKSPEHTGGLAALLDAVPEARVIQLHRDPRTAFASFVSLTRTTQRMFAEPGPDPARSARASLTLLTSELQMNQVARAHSNKSVLDLRYEDLIAEPVATAQRIYQRFGLAWTDEAATGLTRYRRQNPPGRHGPHRYPLDAGLPPEEVCDALHLHITPQRAV
jgi:LPS sulfotransferase NodH